MLNIKSTAQSVNDAIEAGHRDRNAVKTLPQFGKYEV